MKQEGIDKVIDQIAAIDISEDVDNDKEHEDLTTLPSKVGFVTTIVELDKEPSSSSTGSCVSKKSYKQINDTIAIAIEDLLRAKRHEDYWLVLNSYFRAVIIYGKLEILNQFTKDDKTCYKLKIDDGSQKVIGIMRISSDHRKKSLVANSNLNSVINYIKKREVHQTNESQETFNHHARSFYQVFKKFIKSEQTEFRLGVAKEKAIVFAFPYFNHNQEIQLNVIDICFDDKMELFWKCQLNSLYEKEYLK